MTDQPTVSRQAAKRQRFWLFRMAAIAMGLSVFVVAETACILFDWGRAEDYDDPFVGFSAVHPLFVKNKDGSRYEISKPRQKFFAADSFPVEKTNKTFRIFCLGGSTVQGRPFSTPTSFPTWLEIGLNAADPSRDWDVVNCGGISYASYRLVPILKECLQHDPDLIILCTGHNEFLEERTYGNIKQVHALLEKPLETVFRLRTFTLLRRVFLVTQTQSTNPPKPQTLNAEVDALLDYQDGLKAYHRDDAWRTGVIQHFEHNVRRMVRLADDADVPLLLIKPPSNLSDTPPFKSEHKNSLSAEATAEWESLIERAQSHYRDDLDTSIELLHQAIDIDDQYATIYFELGRCYESQRKYERARQFFLKSREHDICPLRILEPMEQSLEKVARDANIPLLDAHQLLEEQSTHKILGNGLLIDHVHPSYDRGHQSIADALFDMMVQKRWVTPKENWKSRVNRARRQHLSSLKNIYFLRGKRTLRALKAWANGRADGPSLESRPKFAPPKKRTR